MIRPGSFKRLVRNITRDRSIERDRLAVKDAIETLLDEEGDVVHVRQTGCGLTVNCSGKWTAPFDNRTYCGDTLGEALRIAVQDRIAADAAKET